MRMELDGEDLEQVEHFPSQENDRNHDHEDGECFPKVQPVAGRLKTPGNQSKNIEGGESEDQHPQNAIYVVLLAYILEEDE